MTITAALVKELREKTGVGMMDCKKALAETNGNFDEAIKVLREKGLAKASKKADRATSEGRIFVAANAAAKEAVIVEILCETDFVSGNEEFAKYGERVVKAILSDGVADKDALGKIKVGSQSLNEAQSEAIMKLGENISVGKFDRVKTAGKIGSYIHMNGKIGVLVEFTGSVSDDIGRGISMHVAASNPLYLNRAAIPATELKNERDIILKQVLQEGKPQNIAEKIVEGKLAKYCKEICLLDQPYVIDPDKTVSGMLPSGVEIKKFIRYALA